MDDHQITSQAAKYLYNVYASDDTILQVKYHFLPHLFSPRSWLDFSEGLQITKCFKYSAAHERKIHTYDIEPDIFP